MGCHHNADIDLFAAGGAQRLEHPLLQYTQDFGLNRQRHIADFIQEQRAAIGCPKTPLARLHGPRKSAFDMAEQFAFQQAFGDRSTIDRHKGRGTTRAVEMDRAGHQFLAGAAFPRQHDRGAAFAHFRHRTDHSPKAGACANHLVKAIASFKLCTQTFIVPHRLRQLQRAING